jgi:plasmid segregation protein ParM
LFCNYFINSFETKNKKTNKRKQVLNMSKIINLGLDVGFGEVKVVGNLLNGKPKKLAKSFKFPTAIARLKRERIKGLENQKKSYLYKEQQFFIGDQVKNNMTIRDIEALIEFSPLFIYKALQDFQDFFNIDTIDFLNAEKNLCVGLPLENFFNYKSCLASTVKDIEVDNTKISFNKINICPQGQGVLFDFFVDENGDFDKDWQNKNLVIIDIGFNTVDILIVENGLISSTESFMLDGFGVCRITEQLEIFLRDQYSAPHLYESELKEILYKKEYCLYNKPLPIQNELKKIIAENAQDLFLEIKNKLNSFIIKSDRLILAGGGAYYIQEYFAEQYPKEFLYYPEQPEFSNSRGYLKLMDSIASDN